MVAVPHFPPGLSVFYGNLAILILKGGATGQQDRGRQDQTHSTQAVLPQHTASSLNCSVFSLWKISQDLGIPPLFVKGGWETGCHVCCYASEGSLGFCFLFQHFVVFFLFEAAFQKLLLNKIQSY